MKTRIAVVLTLNAVILLTMLVLLSGGVKSTAAQEADRMTTSESPKIEGPVVGTPIYPAVRNIDLRTLPQVKTDSKRPQLPLLRLHQPDNKQGSKTSLPEALDPVAQTRETPGVQMPSPNIVFAGLDDQNWGAGWPPDPNGDVGPNHYIQTVNTSIGIYDKTTGTRLAAVTFDDFFNGTSTPCDTTNNGDPIVLYDAMADRWLIADFAWADTQNGPYYECIAISKTGDPVSGGWYMYGFRADDAAHPWLNDYPKLGVWPDGYYMSSNMFDCLNSSCSSATFEGVRVWALDRSSMLSGGPLNNVLFDIPAASGFALLPSNLRGNLPPPGRPDFFAALDDNFNGNDVLHIWKFAVNWTTPLSSTFTGPTDLIAAPFTLPTSNVPQLGSAVTLDTLGDRLMMQLQYRNINGVESLWVNHSVVSGGVIGIRWYEIRDPNGTPAIHQQSTYQPDSNYRWMGSLAVDHVGNMAVGYSVSSASMNPAIRYAGRLASDPLGTLGQGETTLFAGTGSQSGTCGSGSCERWGDYSAMTIDSVDDCTFWYTTEVYTTTGLNWQTRIGSFKFPNCVLGPSGTLSGTVTNAATSAPINGAQIRATAGPTQTNTAVSAADGAYSMTLSAGTYTVTASAFGYQTATVTGVSIVSGTTTTQNLALNPAPVLTVTGVLVSGGDGDNALEPGETANLRVGVGNIGFLTATNASGVLTSTSVQVTILNGSSAYADIAPSATVTNTTLFQVKLIGSYPCGQPLVLNLIVSTDQGSFPLVVTVPTAVISTLVPLSENFDGVVAPALPAGWTTSATGAESPWVTSSTGSDTAPNNAFSPDPSAVGVNDLATPVFTVTSASAQMTFRNNYNLESGFDGGVLEIKIGAGSFTDILAAGGSFVSGGYNGTISSIFSNPLAGRQAWTGNSGGYITTTVNLPAAAAGQAVQLRWRVGSDSTNSGAGQHIDTIRLSSLSIVCDVPTPMLVRSGQTFSDAGGDNDGLIFPGENNLTAKVGLVNGGTLTATNVSGVLTALTPGVTVITNTAVYGTIVPGAVVTNTTNFGFNVGSSVMCGSDLSFGLVANSDQGVYDTGTFAFPVGLRQTATYTNNTSLPIPDNGPPVTSTINIPAAVRNVADVNVLININHTFDGDLSIYLISPAGTRVTLSNRHGGSGDNYVNTLFDDEAAVSIVNGVPPFTGSFRPETPLSAVDLQNVSGDWKLEVQDHANQDVGTLLNWSLIIQTAKCAPTPFLTLNKTASATTIQPGQLFTYTLMAQNNGDLPSTAVVFSDTLPVNVTYVSSSDGGVFSGGTVTWTVGTIPTTTTATRTVVVQVNADVTGGTIFTNTFAVLSAELPPQTSNVATTTVVATYSVDLGPSQAQSGAPGSTVTYTLQLTNTGNTTNTFTLSAGSHAWTVTIPVTSTILALSAQDTLTVFVGIPLTATTGLSDTVPITISGAGGAIDDAALTTTAIVPRRYIYLPIIRR